MTPSPPELRLLLNMFPGNVTLSLSDLSAETKYLVRIVIKDEGRGTSTTDESKVLSIPVTTECQSK